MTILFFFLFRYTYFEFGWKMYKRIRRSEWRCEWNYKFLKNGNAYISILTSLSPMVWNFDELGKTYCAIYSKSCALFSYCCEKFATPILDHLWAGPVHSIFRPLRSWVLSQHSHHDSGHYNSYLELLHCEWIPPWTRRSNMFIWLMPQPFIVANSFLSVLYRL